MPAGEDIGNGPRVDRKSEVNIGWKATFETWISICFLFRVLKGGKHSGQKAELSEGGGFVP